MIPAEGCGAFPGESAGAISVGMFRCLSCRDKDTLRPREEACAFGFGAADRHLLFPALPHIAIMTMATSAINSFAVPVICCFGSFHRGPDAKGADDIFTSTAEVLDDPNSK